MTTSDNRIIARWTLLLCALALTFFTGYLVAPSAPARDTHKVVQACEANTAPTISWMLGNLIACLHAGGVKTPHIG